MTNAVNEVEVTVLPVHLMIRLMSALNIQLCDMWRHISENRYCIPACSIKLSMCRPSTQYMLLSVLGLLSRVVNILHYFLTIQVILYYKDCFSLNLVLPYKVDVYPNHSKALCDEAKSNDSKFSWNSLPRDPLKCRLCRTA